MKVRQILQQKGSQVRRKDSEVITIGAKVSLDEAVKKMVDKDIGSLIVMDENDRIAGIVTERDLLQQFSKDNSQAACVSKAMSRDLIMATPTDHVSYIMGLMTDYNIRHMPVATNKELVGLISIRDVVKALYERTESENKSLKKYIRRTYPR